MKLFYRPPPRRIPSVPVPYRLVTSIRQTRLWRIDKNMPKTLKNVYFMRFFWVFVLSIRFLPLCNLTEVIGNPRYFAPVSAVPQRPSSVFWMFLALRLACSIGNVGLGSLGFRQGSCYPLLAWSLKTLHEMLLTFCIFQDSFCLVSH